MSEMSRASAEGVASDSSEPYSVMSIACQAENSRQQQQANADNISMKAASFLRTELRKEVVFLLL